MLSKVSNWVLLCLLIVVRYDWFSMGHVAKEFVLINFISEKSSREFCSSLSLSLEDRRIRSVGTSNLNLQSAKCRHDQVLDTKQVAVSYKFPNVNVC